MRHLFTAGLLLAGLSVAQAQTVTPGIGGVAITGQSGAGVYIPWTGGTVVGAPGVGSYQLNSGTYVSPYAWNQFNNPTAYNFNTGSFNYNSGVYGWNNGINNWNGGLTTANYYGNPYTSGNVILNSGYNMTPYRGTTFGNGYGSSFTTPVIYSNGNGRGRGRWR